MSELTAVEAILTRRSVRGALVGAPIDPELIELLVRCGGAAPSSKDARPWRFHIVSDRALIEEIADEVELAPGADSYVPTNPSTGRAHAEWSSTVAESAGVLRNAAVCFFVENRGPFSGGRAKLESVDTDVLADALVGYTFEVLGLGAAIENVVLAARSAGLGGAFMGDVVVAEEAIGARLQIEGDLVGVITLGHIDPKVSPPLRVIDPRDPDLAVWH